MRAKEKSRTMKAFNAYNARLSWAQKHPSIFEEGQTWYPRMRSRLDGAQWQLDSLARVAGVAAHMSVMADWTRVMRFTEQMAQEYAHGATYSEVFETAKRGTTYNDNAKKATSLLFGNDLKFPAGAKTGPFHRNLIGETAPVTIDSHIQDVTNNFGLSSITGNARRSMQRAIRMCGTLHGLPNSHAQAIVWIVQRENLGPAR